MTLATLFTADAALTLKGLYNVSIDRARVRRPSFRALGPIVKTFERVIGKENEKELHTDIYIIDVCCGLSASPALR